MNRGRESLPAAEATDHAVHNGNVLARDVVDHHLADVGLAPDVAVPQEEQVAALKGRLHGA